MYKDNLNIPSDLKDAFPFTKIQWELYKEISSERSNNREEYLDVLTKICYLTSALGNWMSIELSKAVKGEEGIVDPKTLPIVYLEKFGKLVPNNRSISNYASRKKINKDSKT